MSNEEKKENDLDDDISIVFLMILENGDLSMLTSKELSKEQEETLQRVLLVCSDTSVVFDVIFYLESLFNKIHNYISRKMKNLIRG